MARGALPSSRPRRPAGGAGCPGIAGLWVLIACGGTGTSSATGQGTEGSTGGATVGSAGSASTGSASMGGTAGSSGATSATSGTSAGSGGGSTGGPDCGGIGPAVDALGTTPGELTLPFPTLEHVTIHWLVSGDTDLDGEVTVRYRELGGGAWSEGLPLRRVPADGREGFSWEDRHAGSLFGLTPDTTYEVELFLLDPDGGCEIRTEQVTTRAVPEPAPGSELVPVTPATLAAALAAAGPGQILELAAGTYASFTVTADGTAAEPLVIRAVAGGGAVIDGEVRLDGRSHVIVEGLEVHAQIKFNDSAHITIRRCTIDTAGDGIAALTRSENHLVTDNIVTGATVWSEAALGVSGNNIGEGIVLTGPGHVVAHNRVSGFRDCISFLEDDGAADQFSLDVLRNDLSECADDGVEADFCFHDCRVVENRLTDTFIALSSQPGLGGPTYFVRNVVYDSLLSAFKLQRGSVGDVALHNTVVKQGDALGIYTTDVFSRQYFRNNLFIGGPGSDVNGYSTGSGLVISLDAADPTFDLDYDGFGSTLGSFEGQLGAASFTSLADLQAGTTAQHAVEVSLAVFATPPVLPDTPFSGYAPPDLALAPGGAAVDAGVTLPGLGPHGGVAPDLGALELGATPPTYGPRP